MWQDSNYIPGFKKKEKANTTSWTKKQFSIYNDPKRK